MNKLLVIPAVIFFILGIIGLLIPIVPQIPFFAVSIFLFAAASEKFKKYIISTKLYDNHLRLFVEKHEKLNNFMHPKI